MFYDGVYTVAPISLNGVVECRKVARSRGGAFGKGSKKGRSRFEGFVPGKPPNATRLDPEIRYCPLLDSPRDL